MTLLSGCSRTQQDWQAAQQAGTPRAYEVFVERHSDSELAGVARERIAQLTEEAAWRQAVRVNTAAAYQGYLAKYPNGSWSQDARIRMQSRSLAAQEPQAVAPAAEPSEAAEPGTAVTAAGQSNAAAGARSAASDAGARPLMSADPDAVDAAVQLGAFSSAGNAEAAWKRLSSRFRPQLRGLTPRVVSVMSSGRRLYRLEARVASQAAARQLCRQLQQHSQGCLTLP
ncbi:MAG TPA: SPOR domain-containing protein [Steroidobacteraceae bacterium]|nr:SPOR domain-containing protein [Steroidobacteraceae bacterium]